MAEKDVRPTPFQRCQPVQRGQHRLAVIHVARQAALAESLTKVAGVGGEYDLTGLKMISIQARCQSLHWTRCWRETDSNFWFRAGGSARRAVWAREGRRLFSRQGKRPAPPVIQSIKLQNELFLRDVAARETAIGGDRSAMEPKLLRSCQLRDGVPDRATFKPAQ